MNKKKIKKVNIDLKNQPNKWNTLAFFMVLVFLGLYVSTSVKTENKGNIAYTEFKNLINDGVVDKVVINGRKVNGQLRQPQMVNGSSLKTFQTVIPQIEDSSLMPLIENKNVQLVAKIEEESWMSTLLISLIPWLLIFGFFYYSTSQMRKRMGGGNGKDSPFSFYKSKLSNIDSII